MKKILLLTAGMMAFTSTAAVAQNSGLETHIGVSVYDDFDLTGIQARVGYMHDVGSFMIGVEGELGKSFTEVSDTIFDPNGESIDLDVGVDTNAAIYGVFRSNRDSKFGLIGRLGYHTTDFGATFSNGNFGNFDFGLNSSGFAGGVGVDYAFSKDRKNVIRLDATYLDLGDLDIDDGLNVFAVSYGHRF